MASIWVFLSTCLLSISFHHSSYFILADKIDMGVVLGMECNHLPRAADIVDLYHKYNIGKVRLLKPDSYILDALRDSDLDVTVSVPNDEITLVSGDQTAAELWYQNNLAPYVPSVNFAYISIGNEAIPGKSTIVFGTLLNDHNVFVITPYVNAGPYAANVSDAMRYLRLVLRGHGLNAITVTTIVNTSVIQNMYPPSAATFTDESKNTMVDVLNFLSGRHASPILMINVYPYNNYSADPDNIGLDFAQFTSTKPKFVDKRLKYYNLFDSMVDAFFWSMEKVKASDVVVAVSESGWPFFGDDEMSTPLLAAAYNRKYMEHVLKHVGTPKRRGLYIEGFIYTMFVENLKPNGVPQSYGLFNPEDMTPRYELFPENPSVQNT